MLQQHLSPEEFPGLEELITVARRNHFAHGIQLIVLNVTEGNARSGCYLFQPGVQQELFRKISGTHA